MCQLPGSVKAGGMAFASYLSNEAMEEKMKRSRPNIDRIMVVMNPELESPDKLLKSSLIRRATEVAKRFDAAIDLFHVIFESSLAQKLFADDQTVAAERKRRIDDDATLLAEIALRMKSNGIRVTSEVQWASPRSGAILSQIELSRPDLVLKESDDNTYIAGLLTHTDWDLVRQADAHVWFVKGKADRVDKMMTAIGTVDPDEDVISSSDYATYQFAKSLASSYSAELHAVHSYQVPPLAPHMTYTPEFGIGPALQSRAIDERLKPVAERHGEELRNFAAEFDLDLDDIQLVAGHPAVVISEQARENNADLVVMGARNLGRWERFSHSVTAEPVLENAPCDILFVRERNDDQSADVRAMPLRGAPKIDVEKAIVDPRSVFDSPEDVANADVLSPKLRRRILEAWETDIRAEMIEEDEGGPVREIDAGCLAEIQSARQIVSRNPDEAVNS